jgi:hypothetical protein
LRFGIIETVENNDLYDECDRMELHDFFLLITLLSPGLLLSVLVMAAMSAGG